MFRICAAFLAFGICLMLPPASNAAVPFRTDLAFAFSEKTRPGTHFWCVFPDIQSHWTVVLYEKRPRDPFRSTYAPLVWADKPAGGFGSRMYQMMTVPPHKAEYCLLVVWRDGVQQPYKGFTQFNPFGWHTFGLLPPLQTLVAEIPAGTPAKDIRTYEANRRRDWASHPQPSVVIGH